MKKIIFLALFAIPMFCRAQTDTTTYQKKIAYCTVEISQSGSKFLATLDDGTKTKASDMEIKDSNGKQTNFKNRHFRLYNPTRMEISFFLFLGWQVR